MKSRHCPNPSDNGGIIAIGTPGQYWSPRPKADALSDIELCIHRYYVQWPGKRTVIPVVNGATGKYLRTDRNYTTRDNLDDLPDL
ncbi:DUF3892 domain-containing protein [Agromyces sp. NPDC055661]